MLFFLELLLLFFLSQQLTRNLSLFIHKKTNSVKASILTLSLLFLPGTIIHELSHAMTAAILQVPVGHMEFLPKLHGETLKMGSVQIGQTDLIRRFFIGTAPFFIGTSLLLLLMWFILEFEILGNIPLLIICGYGIFVISNTMFSSKKDMEGAIEFFLLIGIILAVLYFAGIPMWELGGAILNNNVIGGVLLLGSQFLLVPIIIDILLIGILQLFIRR